MHFRFVLMFLSVLMGMAIDQFLLKRIVRFHGFEQDIFLIRCGRILISVLIAGPWLYFYFRNHSHLLHLAQIGGWLMAFLAQIFFLSLLYLLCTGLIKFTSSIVFWTHSKMIIVYFLFYCSAVVYLIYSFFLAFADPVVEKTEIKIRKFPFSNFSIVQVSDLHLGIFLRKEWFARCVEKINSLEPDLIVITGDLTDLDPPMIENDLQLLSTLKSRLGIYFVLGNHEYYHGVEHYLSRFEQWGITPLLNSAVVISDGERRFNLAGLTDQAGYRFQAYEPDFDMMYSKLEQNIPSILLAHRPEVAKKVNNTIDLVLSGHTHNGQIIFFTPFVKLFHWFIAGLYQMNEHTQLYVNRATGLWGPPIRFPDKGEITLLQISGDVD